MPQHNEMRMAKRKARRRKHFSADTVIVLACDCDTQSSCTYFLVLTIYVGVSNKNELTPVMVWLPCFVMLHGTIHGCDNLSLLLMNKSQDEDLAVHQLECSAIQEHDIGLSDTIRFLLRVLQTQLIWHKEVRGQRSKDRVQPIHSYIVVSCCSH